MKKILSIFMALMLLCAVFAGCSSGEGENSSNASSGADGSSQSASGETSQTGTDFDSSKAITVVSREAGSGTRGAFIELFGIEEEDEEGNKTDKTSEEAIQLSSTQAVMSNIAGDEYAIGYVSLGSLNDTVKAVKIDGAEATVDNINSGSYKVSRPFNIATKGDPTGLTKDFIDFIMSKEGQEVIAEDYISVDTEAAAYAGDKPSGSITVAGSSSVSPVMEKLIEAYNAINPNADIQMQTTDSSSGMQSAIDGSCDIGMASRELKESESAELTSTTIAIDGIAVIVNSANSVENLTSEQVKNIFTGASTTWADVLG